MNMNPVEKYYKPKSISTHLAQKQQNLTNLTDVNIPDTSTIKPRSINYTYNQFSEEKKVEDFQVFYEKLYAKYHKISSEAKDISTDNQKNVQRNQNSAEHDNVQKKIILSRLKKYKAITNNEKSPFSGYMNEEIQGKNMNIETKDSQIPKYPMRVRKFRVLY